MHRRLNGPPGRRRTIAAGGDREAMRRRSEFDAALGLGKPRENRCHDGDHVSAFAATPFDGRQARTRYLVTMSCVAKGVASNFVGPRRGSRTMRPPASPPRSGAMRPRGVGRPHDASMRASGVSPPQRGGRPRGQRAIDGTITKKTHRAWRWGIGRIGFDRYGGVVIQDFRGATSREAARPRRSLGWSSEK